MITNKNSFLRLILAGLIAFHCFACIQNDSVQGITVKYNEDFMGLFGMSTEILLIKYDSLKKSNLDLFEIIEGNILGISESTKPQDAILAFFQDSGRVRLRDSCMAVFKLSHWQEDLAVPMALYKKAFPERSIPDIYALFTDFSYGVFLFQKKNNEDNQDGIGIGQEMFLDAPLLYDQLALTNPNFSTYLSRTFNMVHLPSKIFYSLVGDILGEAEGNQIIDNIILEGKKLYITKQLMPKLADTVLFEFTSAQMAWCKENEQEIWRYLVKDKLLYKSGASDLRNLILPSPHTQGMPPEAPGRAALYIGYKIIKAWVDQESLTLQDISKNTSAADILKRAKYRP